MAVTGKHIGDRGLNFPRSHRSPGTKETITATRLLNVVPQPVQRSGRNVGMPSSPGCYDPHQRFCVQQAASVID